MRFLFLFVLFLSFHLSQAQFSQMRVFSSVQSPNIGSRGDIASFSNGDLVVIVDLLNGYHFQVMRLNKELEITHSEEYSFSDPVYSLQVAVSGDTVYVGGNIRNEASTNIFFMSLDGQLQQLDVQVLENSLNYHLYTFDAHPDGGLYAVGFLIGSQGGTIGNVGNFITRFAGNGQISWFKHLDFASTMWGFGGHTAAGEIMGSGSGSVWLMDKDGNYKWMKSYTGFVTIAGVSQLGKKLFIANSAYSGTEHELFSVDIDGKGSTPVDSYLGLSPHFIGSTQSNIVVGSSYLTTDSAFLRLVFYTDYGKVIRSEILPQAFGFAPTGALRDACNYNYHLRADGTPFVLGVALQTGFFVMKLQPDGSFGCWSNEGYHTPGGQTSPKGINGKQTFDHSTNFIALSSQKGNPIQFSDSLFCRYCKPIGYRLPADTVLCEGDSLELNIPTGQFTWAWADGSTQNPVLIRDSSWHAIKLYTECDTLTDTLKVGIQQKPRFTIQVSDSLPNPNEAFQLFAVPDTFHSFLWTLNEDSLRFTPDFDSSLNENGTYLFKLKVGYNGCYSSLIQRVKVLEVDWYLPTAFSPDENGLNETWGPVGRGFTDYTLRIYNRWGEEVFSSEGGLWDGRFRGDFVPDGQYLFILQGYDDAGVKINRKGTITVLR
ncbi:MAG: gliding motility-associated C-terminal domain-containing protein [Bacteroidetes bacterium]|nr:MAG: gliding motility-associated C-terminal domain-containing protein [Bacteroidota bacterium]